MNTTITYFAKTNWRNQNELFGIFQCDRLMHTYIIGKTGTGKSTLLHTMFMQDVFAGRGACLMNPHGDLADEIFTAIPEGRRKDVVYFNLADRELKLKYNPFKRVSYDKRSLVASGILEVFKKLWHDAWGIKLEHLLRYSILTLLDQPSATIADIPELLLERSFRNQAQEHIVNESVKNFWEKEFPRYQHYDLLPVLNKIGGMLAHPVIKRVLIENPDEISFRHLMDSQKIIIVNLAKGSVGADVAHMLGALFVSSLSSAAFSRADMQQEERKPFMLYLDEFHTMTTLSLVTMFSEMRKFGLGLTIAHQYLNQLEDEIKWAVLGNTGTIISFRISTEDALYFTKEMFPIFAMESFINQPNYCIYLKLLIKGVPSKPFSATTILFEQLVKQKPKIASAQAHLSAI